MRIYTLNLDNLKTLDELRELKAIGKLPEDMLIGPTKEEIEQAEKPKYPNFATRLKMAGNLFNGEDDL